MRAWLSIGSNLGDTAEMLDRAVAGLAAAPGVAVLARSADYRTPPWGRTDQPRFRNGALALETALDPHGLLDACLRVEADLGRVRAERWGPRAIDVDLIACAGVEMADARLVLPHPRALERAFVLVPLAEIAPDLVLSGTRIVDALARLDRAGIERLG